MTEQRSNGRRALLMAVAWASSLLLAGCAADQHRTNDVVIIEQVTDYAGVPTSQVDLPDGRTLEVQAERVGLREDVTVLARPVYGTDDHLIIVSSEDELLIASSVPAVEEGTVDGVLLFASPLDIGYERREYVYDEPPRTGAVIVSAERPVPTARTGEDFDIVCVEVFRSRTGAAMSLPEEPSGLVDHPYYRLSTDTLELACAEADRKSQTITPLGWAFERLAIEPLRQDRAEAVLEIDSQIIEHGDIDELHLELTARENLNIRAPRDLHTMSMVTGHAVWVWHQDGDRMELSADNVEELVLELPGDVRHGIESLEICFEVVDDATRYGMACHQVQNW